MRIIITSLLVTVQCIFVVAAMAASDRCVVIKTEGTVLTLECRKPAEKFQPGVEVKIKSNRTAAVEGC